MGYFNRLFYISSKFHKISAGHKTSIIFKTKMLVPNPRHLYTMNEKEIQMTSFFLLCLYPLHHFSLTMN